MQSHKLRSHSREATLTNFVKYAEAQSRRDYYQSRSNCFPILLNMQSHSREADGTVTPFDKYAESQ